MQYVLQILRERLPRNISDDFIEEMVSNSKLIQLKRNDILVRDGETKRSVYLILNGSIERIVVTQSGEKKTMMFYTPDFKFFLTCYDSYFLNIKTESFLVANESTQVLEFSYAFIDNSRTRNVEFYRYYTNYMERIYTENEMFRNKLVSLDSEKYLEWLYENYSFLFRIFSSKSIASFMGITPEWLSHLKRKSIS